MARNEFENEVRDLLKNLLPMAYKIPDSAFNRNLGRQVSKKPFDFFGYTKGGQAVTAEAKRVKVKRFSFAGLATHQSDELLKSRTNNCVSIFFINFRVKEPGYRCGRAFCIPFHIFLQIKDECLSNKRKSMTPEHIPRKYEMERIAGGWKIKDASIFK